MKMYLDFWIPKVQPNVLVHSEKSTLWLSIWERIDNPKSCSYDDVLKIFDGYVHWKKFLNALYQKIVKVKYVTKKSNNIFFVKY